jgi:hypothetical protein
MKVRTVIDLRTSSSKRIPSMLIKPPPYLGLMFIASQSLIRRAKTLQFCCPTVMLLSFVVESIAEYFWTNKKKIIRGKIVIAMC